MQACGGSSPPFRTCPLHKPRSYKQHMRPIELLPQAVIEKIAAGEVIERPASVLKELIENSIDAEATRIEIFVEDAGFATMRVTDNGNGIPPQDLGKSLLRHATSKIKTADDLFSIGTMGFRGEALASVSAVSRMTICSSAEESGLGYAISSDGGIQAKLTPQPHMRGTTITVRDLFYNVPARKKFMKSRRGEQMAIMRMIEQIVIPFPTIHFSVTIDNKRILDLPVAQAAPARIADIAGPEFARTLIQCSGSREGMDARIYVSAPDKLHERPRFQSLYVNLRRIDNDSVTYAIREAFSQFLGSGFRPSFFCFLDIDPAKIDVNVHPTKQQVKFDDERELFRFIHASVKQHISSYMIKSDQVLSGKHQVREGISEPEVPYSVASLPHRSHDEYSTGLPVQESSDNVTEMLRSRMNESSEGEQTILTFPGGKNRDNDTEQVKENSLPLSSDVHEQMWDLIPCYQIHGVFILAPIKKGILLIDQHAAHERVLFEQALEDLKRGRSASQQLLFPIVMELTPTEKAIIESGQHYFSSFGFEINDFGGHALSVSAIPAFLRDGVVEETIRSMIKFLLDEKDPEAFLEPERRFAAAFACGAAIKAGQKLTQEEMNALLNSLFSTKNPYICPHGRPTLVRISLDELSRRFLR